jgi:hypothetical protein
MASVRRLTCLVDSNIFIALEPHLELRETEPHALAARFVRIVQRHAHLLAVHEATREDLMRDTDGERQAYRLQLLEKYVVLEGVPVSARVAEAVGGTSPNDLVDIAIASGPRRQRSTLSRHRRSSAGRVIGDHGAPLSTADLADRVTEPDEPSASAAAEWSLLAPLMAPLLAAPEPAHLQDLRRQTTLETLLWAPKRLAVPDCDSRSPCHTATRPALTACRPSGLARCQERAPAPSAWT